MVLLLKMLGAHAVLGMVCLQYVRVPCRTYVGAALPPLERVTGVAYVAKKYNNMIGTIRI